MDYNFTDCLCFLFYKTSVQATQEAPVNASVDRDGALCVYIPTEYEKSALKLTLAFSEQLDNILSHTEVSISLMGHFVYSFVGIKHLNLSYLSFTMAKKVDFTSNLSSFSFLGINNLI